MNEKLFLFALFVFVMLLMSYNFTKKKKKVIVFGDSINEHGIVSGGYISKIQSLISKEALEDKYVLLGVDTGGTNVYDWYTRFEKEVLSQHADMVLIFIGMNNVLEADRTLLFHFYREIIHKLTTARVKIIVCDLMDGTSNDDVFYMYDTNNHHEYIRQQADAGILKLVDLRAAFVNADMLPGNDMGTVTGIKMPFTNEGNELIAEAMWKAIRETNI